MPNFFFFFKKKDYVCEMLIQVQQKMWKSKYPLVLFIHNGNL